MGQSLVFRRNEQGTHLQGDPPKEHTFSARYIARELAAGNLQVIVVIPLGGDDSEEELVYRLDSFEQLGGTDGGDGEPRINPAAWQCELVEDEE